MNVTYKPIRLDRPYHAKVARYAQEHHMTYTAAMRLFIDFALKNNVQPVDVPQGTAIEQEASA